MNKPLVPEDLRRRSPIEPLSRATIAFARAQFTPEKNPERIARATWPDDRTTIAMVMRAASTQATTSDSTWAGPLAHVRVQEILQSLGPLSAGAELLRRGHTFTFDGANQIKVPGITVTATSAAFVAEGGVIPVHQLTTSTGGVLDPKKFATIIPLTREMIDASNAEQLVGVVLRDAVAAAFDVALFSTTAGDSTRPPGLLAGLSPLTATTGGGAAALWGDLAQLAAAVTPYGGSDICFVCNPSEWAKLTFESGANFTIPIIASNGVPSKTLICVALNALCSASDPAPRIESGRDWAGHFEDSTPQNISGGTPSPASPVRSFFQTDSVGIRLTMYVAWGLRAPGATPGTPVTPGSISYISSVTW